MNFYVYYLLVLLNSHGTFVVGEFGGPVMSDKGTAELALSLCQDVAKTTGDGQASLVCIPATPENWCKYRGQCKAPAATAPKAPKSNSI